MVAYTKPQQRKKEESERLRGERDKIKFIDLRFERGQAVGFRKARRRQDVPHSCCRNLLCCKFRKDVSSTRNKWTSCEYLHFNEIILN